MSVTAAASSGVTRASHGLVAAAKCRSSAAAARRGIATGSIATANDVIDEGGVFRV